MISKSFPSGNVITYDYDDGIGNKALLRHVSTPEGTIDYTYSCGSQVESMAMGTESVSWTYDGTLVTSEASAGTLNETVETTYNKDGDFLPDGMTYAGTTENYDYDNDNFLTTSGNYTINRKSENGLPDAVTGNELAVDRAFNPYGEKNGETYTVNGTDVGSWSVTQRDLNGRILEKTETINGTTTTYSYGYDNNGRLETVEKDGTIVEAYGYTEIHHGTCTLRTNTLRGLSAEDLGYDEEDRLLSVGSTSYTYTEDGYLATKTNGTEVTTYNYSSRGELLNVTLPDNTLIEYVHDPIGRRIAKKVDGTITEKYLWSGLTTLLAVYDGSDNLLMRFEYADGRMPVSMTKAGVRYYLVYDQTGTLKAVADASGTVEKILEYDTFGYILNDSDTSFAVPFGFAGGLYDQDTGLLRFGYRDYDPEIGRWTAKDPVFFDGGNTDLYGYCLNDPVNLVDPDGLLSTGENFFVGAVATTVTAFTLFTPAATFAPLIGGLVASWLTMAMGGNFNEATWNGATAVYGSGLLKVALKAGLTRLTISALYSDFLLDLLWADIPPWFINECL